MSFKLVLCLPAEDEIETTVEKMVSESSFLIEKTIRYRNGLQIKLVQDFSGEIFQFSMNCSNDTLRVADQSLMDVSVLGKRAARRRN